MAGSGGSNLGPVIVHPLPVAPPGSLIPIVPDPVPPVPIVTTTILPSPTVLQIVAEPPKPNQIALQAAKAGDPEPYIFGRCICTGKIIAADDSTDRLIFDVLWSVGEIEAIEYLIYSGINEGLGTQLGHNQHFLGTAGQATSTIMQAVKGGTYNALASKAHSVMAWLPTYSAGATLDVKAMIQGLKLYDPRTTTTVYSANPALCLWRILTDCSYTCDPTSFSAAADYCDELIGSPQEKRWEVGIQIMDRQDLRLQAQAFAVYCNCFIDIIGSSAYLIPDEPRASTHTVTAAEMVEGTARLTRAGSRNVPERVTVGYKAIVEEGPVDAQVAVTENRTAETATSADAGTTTTIQLPGIQTYSRARRMATMLYNKAHNDDSLEFTSFDDGIKLTSGDVGTITNAAVGLTAQTMALIDNRQVSRGRWQRRYIKYDVSNYSDLLYEEDPTNTTSLSNPNRPPAGPTPTLTEQLYTDEAGVTIARVKITFMGILWAYVDSYKVICTDQDPAEDVPIILDVFKTHTGQGIHTVYTGAVKSGHTYTVDVYVHSNTGALGETPGTADITITAGTQKSLDSGALTNMHRYILDGDAIYCTTSQKTAELGETWASRFGASPAVWSDTLSAGERWLGDQVCNTEFQSEIWDSGQTWLGTWRFIDTNVTVLGGTRANFVSLSADVSPLSFADNAGASYNDTARYMKIKILLTDSPAAAGDGLHIKLLLPAILNLGSA